MAEVVKSSVAQARPPVITAEQLITAARGLKGVPFCHQGRTRFGVDCIGFLALTCKEAGLDLPGFMGLDFPRCYSRSPNPQSLALLSAHCTQILKPVPGCVFYFRFPGEDLPRHFGIFTGDSVIHADGMSRRKVIEHGYRALWLKWTHSMWLVPGVDYSDVSQPA
jgi:cell wall-associated NlpC family hydrolase